MFTKVQKWGNSLAVRLPKSIAKESLLKEGSEVNLGIQGRDVVISLSKKPRYTLKELMKDFDKKKQHKEFDWGKPMGSEVW